MLQSIGKSAPEPPSFRRPKKSPAVGQFRRSDPVQAFFHELPQVRSRAGLAGSGVMSFSICGKLHKLGYPIYECFIMENPIKIDDLEVPPFQENLHFTILIVFGYHLNLDTLMSPTQNRSLWIEKAIHPSIRPSIHPSSLPSNHPSNHPVSHPSADGHIYYCNVVRNVHIYIYIYISTYIHSYIYIYICACTYAYIYIYMHVYIYIYEYMYLCKCVYVNMYLLYITLYI